MAEVPVNINGVIVDYYGRTIMGPIKIVGEMSRTDLGVGGGPIIPPGVPPGLPPGIPTHPIYWPPIPSHPIVLPPDPPTEPPVDPPTNPPSQSWDWGWSPAYGWHPVYVPGDKPQPVPPPS